MLPAQTVRRISAEAVMGVDPEAVKKFREAQPYARRWKSGNLHADPLSFLTLKRLVTPQIYL
jgi:hypothetical protein